MGRWWLKTLWLKTLAVLVPSLMAAAVACTAVDAQTLEGILQNVDSANGKITVVTKDGRTVDITIDTRTPVTTTEGGPSEVGALEPGATVRVEVRDEGRVAKRIEARQGKMEGAIAAIDGSDVTIQPKRGDAVIVHVTDATRIELEEDTDGTLADLAVGQEVEVRFDPESNDAFKIELAGDADEEAKAGIQGVIGAVAGDQVTVENERGLVRTVTVTDETRIHLRGQGNVPGTLEDLKVGLPAQAQFDPATMEAFRIQVGPAKEVEDKAEIHGVVSAVADNQVTIENERGLVRTVTVTDGTRIDIKGEGNVPGILADIRVGMRAQAKFDPATLVASRIQLGEVRDEEAEDDADGEKEEDVDEGTERRRGRGRG